MHVYHTVAEFRAARKPLVGTLGFVPTMGYLHAGHLDLVSRAAAANEQVAVSIFVNPTQFAAGEDLARYPRDTPRDLAMLEAAGVALVFAPPVAEIYPPGFSSFVDVGALAAPLEGAARPGHFRGVATVVCKLLNIVQPQRIYLGQKDAQQVAVIRRMVADLDLPVAVTVCPTVRELDGLALSSRNVYLGEAERTAAPVVSRALFAAESAYLGGERDAEALRQIMRATLAEQPLAQPQYISVADAETLAELAAVDRPALLSLAVRFGATRLIDNVPIA